MADIQFNSLSNDDTIVFDPWVDHLIFDDSINATDVQLSYSSDLSHVSLTVNHITIYFQETVLLSELWSSSPTSGNIRFADGSALIIGDGYVTTELDGLYNSLTAYSRQVQALGLGGADIMKGSGHDDILDGGAGADRME